MTTYLPVLHRIVIKIIDEDFIKKNHEVKTQGGIIITEQVHRNHIGNQARGEVIAVGPTAFLAYGAPNDHVKPGDKVVFQLFAGSETEENDDYIRFINDIDIITIIKDEDHE